ncbi:inosine-5'-monophosphate dehydrogenase [mine drainage metagenome]|uniref:Inosine-5'-monophosphate dehydrogenase n=1 Tax=mine drainage metagenome TaxID=410659 RepID=A0A1J5S3A4_9ZZZZ
MTERTVLQSISQSHVVTVSPEASIFEAARIMTQAHCGSILIVDAEGAMVGIFTERDLLNKVVAQALDPKSTRVAEVMTRNPLSVPPETLVSDAVLLMRKHGFRHLPLLSPTAKLIGVFSMRDASPRELVDAEDLAEHLEQLNDVLA